MKKKSTSKTPSRCKSAERFSSFEGKSVALHLRADGGNPPERLTAVYLDTVPWGRAYFAAFELEDGSKRIIQTEQILEFTVGA